MNHAPRLLGWAVVLGLAGFSLFGRPQPEAPAPDSIFRRLCGPFATLAARAQWVRVHAAMVAGREDLVFQRAETAFALDPGATDGWLFLARHLFFDRASAEREPDPDRRAAWRRSALEVAERGEAQARRPGELALWLGLARVRIADIEGLEQPQGQRALLERAADDFDRAAAAGLDDGLELARMARRLAERP